MTYDPTPNAPQAVKDVSSVIGSVAVDLKAAVTKKFDETVTEVRSQAYDAKDNVAGEVNDIAVALRHASEELRGGSTQERFLGQIASSIADASDALRNKDISEVLQSARKVARDNPALFLGGAALLGFAVSRFAKASAGTAMKSAPKSSADRGVKMNHAVNEGYSKTQREGTGI